MDNYVKGCIAFVFFVIPLFLLTQSIGIDKDSFNYWMDTHWLFNYEHGFIKRGLIGELFRQVGHDLTKSSLSVAQTATIIAVSAGFLALLTWFVLKSYRAGEAWHNATIFAVGFMIATAPGALQQLQFQIGRFDAFGLAILCAVFAITRRSTSPFSLALVTGALVLAILIHEAHFFWVVPLSLWLWFFHGDATKSRTVPLLVISIVTLGAVLIAGTSSYSDYIAFADIKTELSQRSDIPIKDGSLRVQFRSLDDNVTLSAKHNFTFRSIVSFMLGLASLIPYVALLLLAVTAHDRKKSSWALLAACAPLLLVVAGYDQGRWVAMANVSLCLVVIAALSNVRIMPRQAMVLLPLAVLASLCQIFLGPTGDVLSYPYIMRFI